jgi:gamma-glutamyl hercynylcysteine S-oxide synthase
MSQTLMGEVQDARARTLELVSDLSDAQLMAPMLPIVNPLRWEIGHVAWFQEKWVLRHALGRAPRRADADALYDSMAIPHDTRWDLPLPERSATLDYLTRVRDQTLLAIEGGLLSEAQHYFVRLATAHEDMHDEAFTYTRQTYGWAAPIFANGPAEQTVGGGPLLGDVSVPGGSFLLGAPLGQGFVHDNEKWAHPVEVAPFKMARAQVTQADFLAFVEEGGYRQPSWWSEAGWRWREGVDAAHPVYWRHSGDGWQRRDFHRWVPLEPHLPVLHVNWYEAEAYCRFAGRRLPTEVEWEVAASAEPSADGQRLGPRKRPYPWGDAPPTRARANLDGFAKSCVEVGALPDSDSAFGVRQLLGNTWEWTQSDFVPYPGFSPDPYKEYSAPWFGTHKVLRGGCWATRARLIRNTWRNFYTPDRRDVWAGFRTCALR